MQMCFSNSSINTIKPPIKQSLSMPQLGARSLFVRDGSKNFMNIVDLKKSKGCSVCGGGRR